MSEMKKEIKGFAVGSVIGGVIGAVTALLFAPKSGRELRADISNQCQKANVKASEWIGRAKETTEKIGDEVKSLKNRIPFRKSEPAQTITAEDEVQEESRSECSEKAV